MAARSQPSRNDRASIKYEWVPLDAASVYHSDVTPDSHEKNSKKSEPKSSEILSTAQFVSAIGRVWDYANGPLPVSQSKVNVKYRVCEKDITPCYSDKERTSKVPTADTGYFFDLKSANCSRHIVKSNAEHIGVAQKLSLLDSCSRHTNCSFFWRYLQLSDFYVPVESWKVNGLASVGIYFDMGNVYRWISKKPSLGLKYPVNFTQTKIKKCGKTCISGYKTDNLASGSTACNNNLTRCEDALSGKTVELVENVGESVASLNLYYFLQPVTNLRATRTVSRVSSSNLISDYHNDLLGLNEECRHTQVDVNMPENGKRQPKDILLEDKTTAELCSEVRDKSNNALPNQRYAFAGALAGTFVSLCLHPVDTIKTVIQSRRTCQKSICHIVRLITSERGITGLYRGITTNIASSAPISAVYTFTYESVKGTLLPLLPKEYYSIAHCTAGGCASIATSFIFTPSERIKQQMQIGSHYQNCWSALVGVLERGGLPSLYAGWGAVLCRNIPHSIIKFYTYESLKQLVLSSAQSNAPPSTIQTLVCGGLAGSTAALFTTPFDVVKTRLQTEIPGSLSQYHGVFHTLKEIFKHEGLKGLYRGLTPRLVLYVSQGALFFASYEIFKSALSLAVPQLHAPTVQNKQNVEDDSTVQSALPSTTSSPRLSTLHS